MDSTVPAWPIGAEGIDVGFLRNIYRFMSNRRSPQRFVTAREFAAPCGTSPKECLNSNRNESCYFQCLSLSLNLRWSQPAVEPCEPLFPSISIIFRSSISDGCHLYARKMPSVPEAGSWLGFAPFISSANIGIANSFHEDCSRWCNLARTVDCPCLRLLNTACSFCAGPPYRVITLWTPLDENLAFRHVHSPDLDLSSRSSLIDRVEVYLWRSYHNLRIWVVLLQKIYQNKLAACRTPIFTRIPFLRSRTRAASCEVWNAAETEVINFAPTSEFSEISQ